MAEMDIVPYIGTRTPADFDTLFDELEAARGSSASLSDAIAEKAGKATTLSGYGITDAYTKTETDTALSGKQGQLSQSQLAAANSGITAAKLTADEAALAEVVDSGAKNNLNITLTSGSDGGLMWEVNDDLSVTVSGKNTGSSPKQLHLIGSRYIQNAWKGQYLSGVSGGGSSTYKITAYYSNNGSTYAAERTFYNGVLPILENDYIRISLEIAPSYEFTEPYTFKPMICTKTAWDVSHQFVPYCPSMAEMYAMILALQNGTRSAPALALAKAEPEEIKEPETGEEEMR